MRAALFASAFALSPFLQAQGDRGCFFAYWGYNRAWYSWSDLHLYGQDYDFTLRHIQADHRPHSFSIQGYFEPKWMWVPQYNYRLGWFVRDRWSISVGLDHMKCVMRAGQTVRMDGYVRGTRSL